MKSFIPRLLTSGISTALAIAIFLSVFVNMTYAADDLGGSGVTYGSGYSGGGSYSVWRPGQPIVPCGDNSPGSKNPGPCNFNALLQLARNIITFLFWLAVPASLLLFGWAGALYLLGGYNESYIKTAKSIFWYTIWGLIFMAGGWLLVYTITTTLLNSSVLNSPGFLLKNIR